MGRVLDGGNNAKGASDADNNAGAGASDTIGTRDAGSTGRADHNFNNKNAYTKAGFSIYNITGVNTDTDTDNTTGTRDAGSTGDADNNINSKNAYVKAGFSTYNFADANADISTGISNTNGTNEDVSNNINNTEEARSDIMDGSYLNTTFNNRRLAGQGKVPTQLCKNEQESTDEQKGKKIDIEEANETEDEERNRGGGCK